MIAVNDYRARCDWTREPPISRDPNLTCYRDPNLTYTVTPISHATVTAVALNHLTTTPSPPITQASIARGGWGRRLSPPSRLFPQPRVRCGEGGGRGHFSRGAKIGTCPRASARRLASARHRARESVHTPEAVDAHEQLSQGGPLPPSFPRPSPPPLALNEPSAPRAFHLTT